MPDRPEHPRQHRSDDSARLGQSAWVRLISFIVGVAVLAAIVLGWGLLRELWLFILYWLQP